MCHTVFKEATSAVVPEKMQALSLQDAPSIRLVCTTWNVDSCDPSGIVKDPAGMAYVEKILEDFENKSSASDHKSIFVLGFQELMTPGTFNKLACGVILDRWSEIILQVKPDLDLMGTYASPTGVGVIVFINKDWKEDEKKLLRDNIGGDYIIHNQTGYGFARKSSVCVKLKIRPDLSIPVVVSHLPAYNYFLTLKWDAEWSREDAIEQVLDEMHADSSGRDLMSYDRGGMVWMGDFNSRIHPSTVEKWEGVEEEMLLQESMDERVVKGFKENDQLYQALHHSMNRRSKYLLSFSEADVKFGPSYKFGPLDVNRVAWTDRVIYRTGRQCIYPSGYKRVSFQNPKGGKVVSDHAAVTCTFHVRNIQEDATDPRWTMVCTVCGGVIGPKLAG